MTTPSRSSSSLSKTYVLFWFPCSVQICLLWLLPNATTGGAGVLHNNLSFSLTTACVCICLLYLLCLLVCACPPLFTSLPASSSQRARRRLTSCAARPRALTLLSHHSKMPTNSLMTSGRLSPATSLRTSAVLLRLCCAVLCCAVFAVVL